MEIGENITYIGTALGSGGLVQLANWKWGRRKEAASAANKAYTQVAAKTTAGNLQIFNPADLVQ